MILLGGLLRGGFVTDRLRVRVIARCRSRVFGPRVVGGRDVLSQAHRLGQVGETLERGEELMAPGPGVCDAQPESSLASGEPSGDVEQPVAQRLGLAVLTRAQTVDNETKEMNNDLTLQALTA